MIAYIADEESVHVLGYSTWEITDLQEGAAP